ncbi:sensor histidine kinase [Streptomonospora sp. PA3]|uniref:sensor histidine kinase n=1 Tax=Streptomonospora sp. PA3 TaxID=2607326 RepID=UPI0012DF8EC2|nr:sensor histidine kinase [Streptomonospora sp. PA3]MUL43963.1 sensor histidine kinase [Streptomonospora sp. PA3]
MTSRAESAGTDAGRTGDFQHRGAFFSSAEELRGRVLPRLRAALDSGDRAILAVAPRTRAALLAGLPAADAAAVERVDRRDLYDAPGRTLAALHRRARAEHPRPVLVVGEPPMPVEDPMRLREWHRLDSVLTHALAGTRMRLLCLHDERVLPERVRSDVRRTHPVLLARGDEYGSPDYVDPAAFSAPDAARPLPAPAGEQRSLRIGPDLASLRTAVGELAEKAEVPRERLGDLVLAANELAANVVEHGGGTGTLTLWRSPGWVVCDVADRGGGLLDPLCGYRPTEPVSPRGYGLWITRQVCDFMEISGGANGTLVRAHFRV